MSHLRKAASWRIGNEDSGSSMADVIGGPGLFHVKMTATALILEGFWGLPSSEANPASLWAHNTLLGRRKIVLTSPPPFRHALDLVMVSLYGRIFHTLPLAAGVDDLKSYTDRLLQLDGPKPKNLKVSWEQLKRDVHRQLTVFADPRVASHLRKQREDADAAHATQPTPSASGEPSDSTPPSAGDMVFESGVLFFNMSLRLKNLVGAIRSGDSGRIVAILKTLALAFRGTRHTKYAYEMMVFLHNYLHVWPVPLRDAMMKAWLVNISGNPNSSKPADLMQEHLNLLIKTIYKAHGSNESWEWLGMIAPCVHVLRRIAHEFHTTLGDRQGTKHSSVSIEDDIRTLAASLRDHRVCEVIPGRRFAPEDSPPKDVISEGYRRLAHGSKRTIDNYNEYFKNLQRRFKIAPVSSMVPQPTPDQPAASASTVTDRFDRMVEGVQAQGDVGGPAEAAEDGFEVDEEDEEDVAALFDWDQIDEEDLVGIGFSDEEEFVDEESESDDDL
ncbi:hypothetical protein FS749_011947 [Ceratobasidium sp. UAMH 11750]|nr:hypothetical protein FS749_011947 [Ceratobasidium sp. UAMH 11750]